MKKLLLLWLLLPVMACEKKPKLEEQSAMCNCQLDQQTFDYLVYPLSAHKDSLIICRGKTVVDGKPGPLDRQEMEWTDIFQEYTFDVDIPFFDCQTNQKIKLKSDKYSVHYADKRIYTESYMTFNVYMPQKKMWDYGFRFKVYKEEIYAENGAIKVSDATVILEPPVYGAEEIKLVHKQYEEQKINPKKALYHMPGSLFIAAISGDDLSRERLLKYSTDFPENDHTKFVEEAVTLLHDYEKSKKNISKEN